MKQSKHSDTFWRLLVAVLSLLPGFSALAQSIPAAMPGVYRVTKFTGEDCGLFMPWNTQWQPFDFSNALSIEIRRVSSTVLSVNIPLLGSGLEFVGDVDIAERAITFRQTPIPINGKDMILVDQASMSDGQRRFAPAKAYFDEEFNITFNDWSLTTYDYNNPQDARLMLRNTKASFVRDHDIEQPDPTPYPEELLGIYQVEYFKGVQDRFFSPEESETAFTNCNYDICVERIDPTTVKVDLMIGSPDGFVGTVDADRRTITFNIGPYNINGVNKAFLTDQRNADKGLLSPVVATFDEEYRLSLDNFMLIDLADIDNPWIMLHDLEASAFKPVHNSDPIPDEILGTYTIGRLTGSERLYSPSWNKFDLSWSEGTAPISIPVEKYDEYTMAITVPLGLGTIKMLGNVDLESRQITFESGPYDIYGVKMILCNEDMAVDRRIIGVNAVATFDKDFNIDFDGWTLFRYSAETTEAVRILKDIEMSISPYYDQKCPAPHIEYDGHDVSIASTLFGASIHYYYVPAGVADGEWRQVECADVKDRISHKFDVESSRVVKAYLSRSGFANSDTVTVNIGSYYSAADKTATVHIPGTLAEIDRYRTAHSLSYTDLTVKGIMSEADYAAIRDMSSIQHLALQLDSYDMPDRALSGMMVSTVSLASTSAGYDSWHFGADLFDGCQNLAAIDWSLPVRLPDASVGSLDKPNLLLYCADGHYPEGIANVVTYGSDGEWSARSITLTDGEHSDFVPIHPFKAGHISYTHTYSLTSGIGTPSGWETLTLPFDVQQISYGGNAIAPFGHGADSDAKFWLYTPADGAFAAADGIRAYTPYLICMPNNDRYADRYNIAGEVTFSADDIHISQIPDDVYGDEALLIPTTVTIYRSFRVLSINREPYGSDPAGSVFISGLRNVMPFEAYIRSSEARMAVAQMLNSTSGVEDVAAGPYDISIHCADGVLYINAAACGDLPVFAIDGRCVDSLHLTPGINVISSLHKGLYIIAGRKVAI